MSTPRTSMPTELGPVFTTSQAVAAGVSAGRRRSSDIRILARGLYARVGVGASAAQIVSALCRDDPDVFACGPTAAELLGMPLPHELRVAESGLIHMGGPAKRRNSSIVQWHRSRGIASDDLVRVDGMRMTSRNLTWSDLGRVLGCGDLVAIADHLVRRPRDRYEGRSRPYASFEQLAGIAESRAGQHGARALREALTRTRMGSDSPAETAVRLALEDAGLPRSRVNIRVDDGGEDLGQPDLSWPEYRVCLEHEGGHHLDREQQAHDIERTERRVLRGWIEVRTVASDLRRNGARAVSRVSDALRRHGWTG